MKKKLLILLLFFPLFAFAQGAMDFEGIDLPTGYSDGSFEADGISYTYGHSRDQGDFAINEQGLMLRYPATSYLEWTVPNGMGQLSFQYRKAFSGGNARQLEVYVNDEVVATTDEFGADSGEEEDIYTLTHNVNLDGELTIKIKNVGTITQNRQTVIDNIEWTVYDAGDDNSGEAVEATIQLGSGNSTNVYLPFYYLYDHSYTQTIYTAEEMHSAGAQLSGGDISMISYLPNVGVSTERWKSITIYMANTSKSGFSGSSDWVDASELTLVFDGEFEENNTTPGQWMNLTLDTPFEWDGSSNILVAVTENTPDYGNNPGWRSYTLAPDSGSKAIYRYRDNLPITPNDPGTANSTTNNVAQILFHGTLQSACSGTPDGGTLLDFLETCPLNPIELIASDYTMGAAGLVYQWEMSTNETDWEIIEGAVTGVYTLEEGISESTYFRFSVTCETSDETSYSNNMLVTLSDVSDCYCTPGFSASVEPITLVEVLDGGAVIMSNAAYNTTDAYVDYTDISVELEQGGTYGVELEGDTDGNYTSRIVVYVDWNQDGQFTEDEMYQLSDLTNTTGFDGTRSTGTIEVPEDAPSGTTRMRVMKRYSFIPDSCNTAGYGQAHDYTVVVLGETDTPECDAPEEFDAEFYEDGVLSVMIDGDANYEVLYGEEGFDPTGTEGTSVLTDEVPIVEIEGLEPGVYDVYVRTICDDDVYSDWAGPVSIELETEVEEPCEEPTGFSSIYNEDLGQISVVVNDSSNIYEVVLGSEGFDPDSNEGTSVFTQEGEPIAVFAGPFEDGEYDVYVRTVCDEDLYSDWVGPETIAILGIADVLFENFKFYPNPVQDAVSLDAKSVITQVEVFNLLGQKVMQEQPNNLQAQINLSDLQSGTYLLKVSIEGVDRSFHLIKK